MDRRCPPAPPPPECGKFRMFTFKPRAQQHQENLEYVTRLRQIVERSRSRARSCDEQYSRPKINPNSCYDTANESISDGSIPSNSDFTRTETSRGIRPEGEERRSRSVYCERRTRSRSKRKCSETDGSRSHKSRCSERDRSHKSHSSGREHKEGRKRCHTSKSSDRDSRSSNRRHRHKSRRSGRDGEIDCKRRHKSSRKKCHGSRSSGKDSTGRTRSHKSRSTESGRKRCHKSISFEDRGRRRHKRSVKDERSTKCSDEDDCDELRLPKLIDNGREFCKLRNCLKDDETKRRRCPSGHRYESCDSHQERTRPEDECRGRPSRIRILEAGRQMYQTCRPSEKNRSVDACKRRRMECQGIQTDPLARPRRKSFYQPPDMDDTGCKIMHTIRDIIERNVCGRPTAAPRQIPARPVVSMENGDKPSINRKVPELIVYKNEDFQIVVRKSHPNVGSSEFVRDLSKKFCIKQGRNQSSKSPCDMRQCHSMSQSESRGSLRSKSSGRSILKNSHHQIYPRQGMAQQTQQSPYQMQGPGYQYQGAPNQFQGPQHVHGSHQQMHRPPQHGSLCQACQTQPSQPTQGNPSQVQSPAPQHKVVGTSTSIEGKPVNGTSQKQNTPTATDLVTVINNDPTKKVLVTRNPNITKENACNLCADVEKAKEMIAKDNINQGQTNSNFQQSTIPIKIGNFEKMVNPDDKFRVKMFFYTGEPGNPDCKRFGKRKDSYDSKCRYSRSCCESTKDTCDIDAYLRGKKAEEGENKDGENTDGEDEDGGKKKKGKKEKKEKKKKGKKEKKDKKAKKEEKERKKKEKKEKKKEKKEKKGKGKKGKKGKDEKPAEEKPAEEKSPDEKPPEGENEEGKETEKVLSQYRMRTVNPDGTEGTVVIDTKPRVANIEKDIVFKSIREIAPQNLGDQIIIRHKTPIPRTIYDEAHLQNLQNWTSQMASKNRQGSSKSPPRFPRPLNTDSPEKRSASPTNPNINQTYSINYMHTGHSNPRRLSSAKQSYQKQNISTIIRTFESKMRKKLGKLASLTTGLKVKDISGTTSRRSSKKRDMGFNSECESVECELANILLLTDEKQRNETCMQRNVGKDSEMNNEQAVIKRETSNDQRESEDKSKENIQDTNSQIGNIKLMYNKLKNYTSMNKRNLMTITQEESEERTIGSAVESTDEEVYVYDEKRIMKLNEITDDSSGHEKVNIKTEEYIDSEVNKGLLSMDKVINEVKELKTYLKKRRDMNERNQKSTSDNSSHSMQNLVEITKLETENGTPSSSIFNTKTVASRSIEPNKEIKHETFDVLNDTKIMPILPTQSKDIPKQDLILLEKNNRINSDRTQLPLTPENVKEKENLKMTNSREDVELHKNYSRINGRILLPLESNKPDEHENINKKIISDKKSPRKEIDLVENQIRSINKMLWPQGSNKINENVDKTKGKVNIENSKPEGKELCRYVPKNYASNEKTVNQDTVIDNDKKDIINVLMKTLGANNGKLTLQRVDGNEGRIKEKPKEQNQYITLYKPKTIPLHINNDQVNIIQNDDQIIENKQLVESKIIKDLANMIFDSYFDPTNSKTPIDFMDELITFIDRASKSPSTCKQYNESITEIFITDDKENNRIKEKQPKKIKSRIPERIKPKNITKQNPPVMEIENKNKEYIKSDKNISNKVKPVHDNLEMKEGPKSTLNNYETIRRTFEEKSKK